MDKSFNGFLFWAKINIEQVGNADTNAAVVGALLGVKHGFSSIPNSLIKDLLQKMY